MLYINFGRNTVTGLVPFFTLSILNYLVYSHLKGRRNTMAQITGKEIVGLAILITPPPHSNVCWLCWSVFVLISEKQDGFFF